MRSKKSTKTYHTPEELLNNAYKCKKEGIKELIEEIETKIKL